MTEAGQRRSRARRAAVSAWALGSLALALVPAASAAQPAGGAPAQASPGPRIVREPDRVVVRKKTVIDFSDVTVEGELLRPEGSYLLDRRRARFPSLVKLRDDFNPELQKSADNL